MTSVILLSNGLQALVDHEDLPLVGGRKWSAYCGGRYAARNEGGRKHRRCVYMHRLVLGAPDGVEVDHVNGNGLDNRKANLRLCGRRGQMRNLKAHADGSSGLKGVSWNRDNCNWRAQIYIDGQNVYLGCFQEAREAAVAYDRAAREHFGEYARTNEGMGLL